MAGPKPELLGRGGLVLYLDYDGVLHHHAVQYQHGRLSMGQPGERFFAHAHLLERVLATRRGIQIVLSTSWVRMLGVEGAAQYLPPAVRALVVDSTALSPTLARGEQVLDDVRRRRPLDWVAIDDDVYGWPANVGDRLVRSDPERGLAEDRVLKQLAAALEAMELRHSKGGAS